MGTDGLHRHLLTGRLPDPRHGDAAVRAVLVAPSAINPGPGRTLRHGLTGLGAEERRAAGL